MAARVLVIEDDDEMAGEIAEELGAAGHAVRRAATGGEGLRAAMGEAADPDAGEDAGGGSAPFDLVVLDRMLPGMDGLEIVARLREAGSRVPVLVISALSAVDDRVFGLKAGGDDYLTKPFALRELLARTEALLRRPAETRETVLRAGPLVLDLIERSARRGERALDLLPREFRLLEYMVRRPDRVLTRAMLLEDVWRYRFVPQTNLVDVHIGRLRRKVDAAGDKPLIQSVRGTGFCLKVSA